MINGLGKLALSAGKAVGKFAVDHKEEILEFCKDVLTAVILSSLNNKAVAGAGDTKSDTNNVKEPKKSKINLSKD